MESLTTNILSSGPSTGDKANRDSDDERPHFEGIDQEVFSGI